MASQELRAFFPSPAHPALPIASQLLSTLRNLTGPSKGVNLKAEERTALAGVAALLACEKIQSKDLTESSAQKASHVAPSQFRSALALCRRLLQSASAASSEALGSTSSPKGRSSPTKSTSSTTDGESSADAAARAAALSPFSTPRKKFRPAASGVDISELSKRGAHSPARGSPLKQSLTPSTSNRPIASARKTETERPTEVDEEAEEVVETPSKRAKTGITASPRASSRRKAGAAEDTSAFFALRPGSMVTPPDFSSGASRVRERSTSPTPRRDAGAMLSARRTARGENRKKRKKMREVDWTFHEDIWGGAAVTTKNDAMVQKILDELPTWLAEHSLPSLSSVAKGVTVADILLQRSSRTADAMEVDV